MRWCLRWCRCRWSRYWGRLGWEGQLWLWGGWVGQAGVGFRAGRLKGHWGHGGAANGLRGWQRRTLVGRPKSVGAGLPERWLVNIRWVGRSCSLPMEDGLGLLPVRELLPWLAALRSLARGRGVGVLNPVQAVGVWL